MRSVFRQAAQREDTIRMDVASRKIRDVLCRGILRPKLLSLKDFPEQRKLFQCQLRLSIRVICLPMRWRWLAMISLCAKPFSMLCARRNFALKIQQRLANWSVGL